MGLTGAPGEACFYSLPFPLQTERDGDNSLQKVNAKRKDNMVGENARKLSWPKLEGSP